MYSNQFELATILIVIPFCFKVRYLVQACFLFNNSSYIFCMIYHIEIKLFWQDNNTKPQPLVFRLFFDYWTNTSFCKWQISIPTRNCYNNKNFLLWWNHGLFTIWYFEHLRCNELITITLLLLLFIVYLKQWI